MGRRSGYDSSSKAVIWIVVGIVGGLSLFGAGILVLGVMAYRGMGTSAKATISTESGKGGPVAKVEGPKQNGVNVGNIALEIAGRDMDGKPLKLSDYKGKVVLLDFWGNW
jgi:cytochrome oxidase Cu insertion factor (SCO1/SenC/PrrC family)